MSECLDQTLEEARECVDEREEGVWECRRRQAVRSRVCDEWALLNVLCNLWSWVMTFVCISWEFASNMVCYAYAAVEGVGCSINRTMTKQVVRSVERNIGGIPQKMAVGFNISNVDDQHSYSDSGAFYEARINNANQVEIRQSDTDAWQPLVPPSTIYDGSLQGPLVLSYFNKRGPGNKEKRSEAEFDIYAAPEFDMLAASENRLFVKEKGKDTFYIASMVRDFRQFRRPPEDTPVDIPGYYAKLDPEQGSPDSSADDLLMIHKESYYNHVSVENFLLYNVSQKLMGRAERGFFSLLGLLHLEFLRQPLSAVFRTLRGPMMLVRFDQGFWHILDTRPPRNSAVPPGMKTYVHVEYGRPNGLGILGTEKVKSIYYNKVLGIGVGRLHRHTQYESAHGGELHVLAFNSAQVGDFASFYDGTCNYFILTRLKDPADVAREPRNTYGILWIDEQTYYGERWRLVDPCDDEWYDLSRGIATFGGPQRRPSARRARDRESSGEVTERGESWWHGYEDEIRYDPRFRLDRERFWSPFDEIDYITGVSRIAVARQTLIVTGQAPNSAPLASVSGEHLIFSLVFSWGSIDRTWRWRRLPPNTEVRHVDEERENSLRTFEAPLDAEDVETVYPQTIGIRDDMTIHLRGTKRVAGQIREGVWFQKYLPADNWERPFLSENATDDEYQEQIAKFPIGMMPHQGFAHAWHFTSSESFKQMNTYSHFGVYETVSSRSQFYELEVLDSSEVKAEEVAKADPRTRWVDIGDRMSINAMHINYDKIEDWVDRNSGPRRDVLNPSPEDLNLHDFQQVPEFLTIEHRPPSHFNSKSHFKIVNRPHKEHPTTPRLVAMWWDKRDDDLMEVEEIGEHVSFVADQGTRDLQGRTLQVRLKKRSVLWKPPVVQYAHLSLEPSRRQLRVTFRSEIPRRPRFYRHWKRSTEYEGCGMDLLGLIRAEIDNVDPCSGQYPCSDNTIHRAVLNVIGEKGPIILWDALATDFEGEFGQGQFLFSHKQTLTEPGFTEIANCLIGRGPCENATAIYFEDVTGHRTMPEDFAYLIAGCEVNHDLTWDSDRVAFSGVIHARSQLKILSRSRSPRKVTAEGGDIAGAAAATLVESDECRVVVNERAPSLTVTIKDDSGELAKLILDVTGLNPSPNPNMGNRN